MSSRRSRAIGSTTGTPPACATAAAQHPGVRVHDLRRSRRLVDLDELRARRDDRDARAAAHRDRRAADRREHADVGGTDDRSRAQDRRARRDVLAARPHVRAALQRDRHRDDAVGRLRVLDLHDRVGAVRE
jgi:hypothetical protein